MKSKDNALQDCADLSLKSFRFGLVSDENFQYEMMF